MVSSSMGRMTAALIFMVWALSACRPVPGNYPTARPEENEWASAERRVGYECPDYFILVGERKQIEKTRERRASMLKAMAAGTNEAAVAGIVARKASRHSFLHRLLAESENYHFYKAGLHFRSRNPVLLKRGDFLLTFVSRGDTLQCHDEGLVMIKHDAPAHSLWTADGPIEISHDFNGIGRKENRMYIRSSVRGKIIDIIYAPEAPRLIGLRDGSP